MAFSIGNPINTALVLYIVYRVNSILFPSISPPTAVPHDFRDGYSWMPKSHPPTMLYKALMFTLLCTVVFTTQIRRTHQRPWRRLTERTAREYSSLSKGLSSTSAEGATFMGQVCNHHVISNDSADTSQEGMYANFAGRDASRGMAKQSFDEGLFGPVIAFPH